jgi:hypothetical protein
MEIGMKFDLFGISSWAIIIGLCCSCQPQSESTTSEPVEMNPAAEGFDMVNSDEQAIAIADQVMDAMGGRTSWDQTRYLCWDFFGSRHLIWDKQNGDVRIDFPDGNIYQVNVFDGSGKVLKDSSEVVHPDSLAKELDRAKRIWINDSYWLVMPFKLKDSGVTLKYLGVEQSQQGVPSHVLQLTFKNVGVTPQNRYLVYVDTSSNLVNQWAFYREADQDSANFVLPWDNYQQHGKLLLSSNRGERNLNNVQVLDSLPAEIFTSLEPVDLNDYN